MSLSQGSFTEDSLIEQPALATLNPDLPGHALQLAIDELLRDRGLMSPAQANREVYGMLKEGVKVTYRDLEGIETSETARLVDWENPLNNDFFLAAQLWITSDFYQRRPDWIQNLKTRKMLCE